MRYKKRLMKKLKKLIPTLFMVIVFLKMKSVPQKALQTVGRRSERVVKTYVKKLIVEMIKEGWMRLQMWCQPSLKP